MKAFPLLLVLVLGAAHLYGQEDSLHLQTKSPLTEKNYVSLEYRFDHFSDDLANWNTATVEAQNNFDSWVAVTRLNVANRFGEDAWSVEQDIYKKFKSNDYLFLNGGYSPSPIFARMRLSGEYFNPFAQQWEHSMGARYIQFQDTTHVFLLTGSLSKYSGAFLTILRANVGFQNSSSVNVFSGSLQQRYYYKDDSYVAVYGGYGEDPNALLFSNNPAIRIENFKTLNLGVSVLHQIDDRWYVQARTEFQKLNFGTVERNQLYYALKVYYTWE